MRAIFIGTLLIACKLAHADSWESKDSYLLGGALGMMAVDWAQTRDIKNYPLSTVHEANPLMGSHPSDAAINRYFVLAMGGTALAAYALPLSYQRKFLGGVLILEAATVLHNHSIGLRFNF